MHVGDMERRARGRGDFVNVEVMNGGFERAISLATLMVVRPLMCGERYGKLRILTGLRDEC